MTAETTRQRIWDKIREYSATTGRGEKPAFIILHSAAVMAIELDYWQNPSENFYYPPRGLGDVERVFGVPILRCDTINKYEILLGVTQIEKREI